MIFNLKDGLLKFMIFNLKTEIYWHLMEQSKEILNFYRAKARLM